MEVEKRREQRKKLNEYYHRYKRSKIEYVCIFCDKRFGHDEDFKQFIELDPAENTLFTRNGVICNECSPTCPYCGKKSADGLIASAFEQSEVLESYGEIFLFCLYCMPSCPSGEHMGYSDEECKFCEEDEENDEDYYEPQKSRYSGIKRIL